MEAFDEVLEEELEEEVKCIKLWGLMQVRVTSGKLKQRGTRSDPQKYW